MPNMNVQIVSANLDAITNPETIPSPRWTDAELMFVGDGKERALGCKIKKYGSGKEGNHNSKAMQRMKRRASTRNG